MHVFVVRRCKFYQMAVTYFRLTRDARLVPQYSEWTVGSLSSVTCAPMFMQFTGCHQPVQGFYWPENAIDWLRKC